MPGDPTPNHTARVLWGYRLRDAARYLFARPPGYGWTKAADLILLADQIDPDNRDEAMSQRGKNVAALIAKYTDANDAVIQRDRTIADLQAKLAAATKATQDDPEDAAAFGRLDQVLAAPPVPQPAPPTPATVKPSTAPVTTFTVPLK